MNPIAWLRRLFTAPPPAVDKADAEPEEEQPLTLKEARVRFREALAAWESGEASTEITHAEMASLGKNIFSQCITKGRMRSQDAYDFFNLAGEMSNATSYEPKSRWIAKVGLQLEAEALGSLYSHPGWREIVAARGPIEHFVLKKCLDCGLEFPEVGTSGFMMMTFLWCGDCGNIYGAPLASEECERRLRPYANWLAAGQQRVALELEVPWHRCTCGGVVHHPSTCPRCKSRNERHERLPISSFQYFENHTFGNLDQLPTLLPPDTPEGEHGPGSGT